MKMILFELGGLYLFMFLRDFILPAIPVTVMGIGLSFLWRGIRNKNHVKSIVGILLTVIMMILIMRSSFIRSRRVVDTEWMIGKTIEQVRNRYYCPKDKHYTYEAEKEINGVRYTLCNVETYIWSNIDDNYYNDQLYYYVLTDMDGRITEVRFLGGSLDGSIKEHSYLSRWYVHTF